MDFLHLLDLAPAPHPTKNRPSVKRLLNADGANLIAFTFSPGQSLPDHRSAHPVTLQALTGELTVSVDGSTHTLTPGTIIHINAQHTHRVDSVLESGDAVLLLSMLTGEKVS
ncbi:hypothetical protein CDES_09235 [Corynebacterium deserti GIMN1.010]|uniref:Cupin type-2 domain-containing protein n=1 Tax=Corynebacterium deserti GIMN1.010 TaxID=931089 RepID=A0A0M3Q9T1_9CORY|nr:cupin domain-containing protein [Corynebacterium deserti]ALC06239.1 hypothetical protein CDES_09235 [Corynebacterium deserti GIMN1.010]